MCADDLCIRTAAAEVRLCDCGMEAQADVIGDPVAVGIAKDWLEECHGLGEDGSAVRGVELVEDSVAEGVEPGVHSVG